MLALGYNDTIYESQIRSLKELGCLQKRNEKGGGGIFLTKIEFNLGDFGLFLILQPELLPRVIEVLKLIEKMPWTTSHFLGHQMVLSGKEFKIS